MATRRKEKKDLDWIEKLQKQAEQGTLDEESLNPSVLLGISKSRLAELKSKSKELHNKKTKKNQTDLDITDWVNSDSFLHSFSYEKSYIHFVYDASRKLNAATLDAIETGIKAIIKDFFKENKVVDYNIIFHAGKHSLTKPNTKTQLIKNKIILIDFSAWAADPLTVDSETILIDKGITKRNTFKFKDSTVDAGKLINSACIECFFNPFLREQNYKIGVYKTKLAERLNITAKTLAPIFKKIEVVEPSLPEGTVSDEELIQAIDDIEILKMLFNSVATDLTKEYNKNKKAAARTQKDFQKGIDNLLDNSQNRRRLEKQVESLKEIAKESGIDFSAEIKKLEKELKKYQTKQTKEKTNIKNIFEKQKEIETRNELLQKEMAGYRGNQLFKSLTELERIRSNSCVASARLEEGRGKLYLNIVLYPYVMKNKNKRYLLGPLNFRLTLTSSNKFVSIKWIWDKNNPRSRYSPHPHVSASGTTCWGEAESPIRDAIKRNEFSTVIRYITGWASIYNSNSPYVYLNSQNFQETKLPVGWHPEIL